MRSPVADLLADRAAGLEEAGILDTPGEFVSSLERRRG
jgi:hypothetical protein